MLVSSTCITVTIITEKVMAHLWTVPTGASLRRSRSATSAEPEAPAQRREKEPPGHLEPAPAQALLAQGDLREEPAQPLVGGGGADDRVHERRVGEDTALDAHGIGKLRTDLPPPAGLVDLESAGRHVAVLQRLGQRLARVLSCHHGVVDTFAGVGVDKTAGVATEQDTIGDSPRERPAKGQPIGL